MIDYQEKGGVTVFTHKLLDEWTSPAAEITQTTLKRKRKILISPPWLEPTIFWSRVQCYTNWAITAIWHMGEPLRFWLGTLWSKPRGLSWMRIAWWGHRFWDNTYHTQRNPKAYAWCSNWLGYSYSTAVKSKRLRTWRSSVKSEEFCPYVR